MSSFSTLAMGLLMILLETSPMPIGLTPGHLLVQCNQTTSNKGSKPEGSTIVVQIFFAAAASASHRSFDAPPEGPAAPSILRTVSPIIGPFISSKMTGCGSTTVLPSFVIQVGFFLDY